jgi:aspartate aminotransferase
VSGPDAKAGAALPIRPAIAGFETQQIMQVSELALGDPDVIPLWYGESDLPTPDFICDAAARAMAAGETFYTHKRGLPELRRALGDYTKHVTGADVDFGRITVTSSGMTAIMIAMQVLVDPGDRVVLVGPVWPNAGAAVRVMGGAAHQVPLDFGANGWRLDLDRLFDTCTPNTRALFVNSPNNPTGWMMTRAEQEAVLAFCRDRGIWIMADEVYGRIVYDRALAPSFLEIAEADDLLLAVNTFSKNWAMTGWRVGWLIHPEAFAKPYADLIEFNTSGTPAFLQRGCIAALEHGEDFVAAMVARCAEGRDIVDAHIKSWPGVRYRSPEAAFYAFFAPGDGSGMTESLAFAKDLVRRAGVGLAPGTAFGPEGEGWLRLCFAREAASLEQAMQRLDAIFA